MVELQGTTKTTVQKKQVSYPNVCFYINKYILMLIRSNTFKIYEVFRVTR